MLKENFKIKNRYFNVRLKVLLPLFIIVVFFGYNLVIIYNVPSLSGSVQSIKLLIIYIASTALLSFFLGIFLVFVIGLYVNRMKNIPTTPEDYDIYRFRPYFLPEKEIAEALTELKRAKESWEEEKRRLILSGAAEVNLLINKIYQDIKQPLAKIKEILNPLMQEPDKKAQAEEIMAKIEELSLVIEHSFSLTQAKDLEEAIDKQKALGLDNFLDFALKNIDWNNPVGLSVIIDEFIQEIEEKVIRKVLLRYNFNREKTAQALKISRKSLYNKMKRYGITL